ncbi:hypothetical protein GTQ40_11305 [Flavobacteriaceae bacterium R38]|nr:hypothetical protein [Flavobacteriaceae bacterium R38]
MKIKFLTTIVFILCAFVLQAQSDKKSKSKRKSISVSVSASSNSSYSSSSTSINSDDDSYSMSSRFNKDKTEAVKALLYEELGNKNLSVKNSRHEWESIIDDDIAYIVRLTNGRLKIFVDKELVSTRTYEMFERLGDEVSEIVSSKR